MKKILCPTDFSKAAENSIAYAAKLAKKVGASLHLLHVNLLSELTPEEALVGTGMHEGLVTQKLEDECKEVGRVFRISCFPEEPARGMSLAREIGRVADGFDLIVMGTNGENGLSQDLFGSNTYSVIRNTNVPLLMIPEQCGYSEVQHIIFAYDYWRNNNIPAGRIVAFAEALGARLTIVQVMETYSRDAEVELEAQQTLIQQMYSARANISFEILYDNDIGEAINQFVMRSDADMLAMCFHPGKFQRMFYSGIVRRVTTETVYPLFVIH